MSALTQQRTFQVHRVASRAWSRGLRPATRVANGERVARTRQAVSHPPVNAGLPPNTGAA